jgi:hypothetical protein
MSTYTSNSVVLVERHYIPLELYQQVYVPQRLAQPTPSVSSTNTNTANGEYGYRTTTRTARPSSSTSTATTAGTTGTTGNLFQTVMENFFPRSSGQSSNQQSNASVNSSHSTSNVSTGASMSGGNTRRIVVSDVFMDSTGANTDGLLLFNTLFRAAMEGNEQGSSHGLTATEISRNSERYEISENSTRSGALTCSICTSEYEPDDAIRRLYRCSHEFHETCIDTWLAAHNNCPVCRATVIANIDNID